MDHRFSDPPRFPQCRRVSIFACRILMKQALQLFIEEMADQFAGMPHRASFLVSNFDRPRMSHPLRDHQAIDAVRRQIFHVTIKEARTFSAQNAVPVANDRAHRRARSCKRALSNARRPRPQIRACSRILRACMQLIG
jgi:hypothetical protein